MSSTPAFHGRRGRRAWALVTLVALMFSLGQVVPVERAVAAPNPVVLENQQPGTSAWQLGRPGFSISDDATGQIKGYASATSVDQGQQVDFQVSVSPAQSFTASFYRMGYYGGLGGRLMGEVGPIAGTRQNTCAPVSTTGMVDCGWTPTFSYTIPTTWTSGVYLVVLTNAANYQSYMTFVVRDDDRRADLLYQQSVTTYQAYNNYPIGTGKSMYEFNSYGGVVQATNTVRAAKVSFDRPYADGYGSGQLAGNGWNWERYYISWLEQQGYDVSYSTNLDTHRNGARILDFKGFLSVGHDEYWSKSMFDAAVTARDAGVSLGFFGSNTAYWQVRFEASAGGATDRVMVCYKRANLDPVKDSNATVLFRDAPVNRPEQTLVGVQYTAHLQNDGNGAIYRVQNSDNWVWEGTGYSNGTQVPGILGYETDRLMTEYPSPANLSYTTLSVSPVVDAAGVPESASSAIYQAPSGAWVFASGSNHWSFGLGKPGVTNAAIQRATTNILNRFLNTTPPPPTPPAAPSSLTAVAVSESDVDLTWQDNSSNETSFTLERSADGVTWSVVTSTLAPGATSYRDTGLAPTTAYRYRVRATNAAGASDYSNTVVVTTPAPTAVVFAESFPGEDGSPWDAGRWTVNTGTTASLDVQSGAGRMAFQNVSGARALAVAKMTKQVDTEVLASYRYGSNAPAARGFMYLATRASGDWVSGYPNTSYFLQLTSDISNVQLWKSQAGVTSSLGSTATMAAVTTAKQWVRMRVQGSTISAKIWTDGSPEPSGWELTATDGSITGAGLVQLKWTRSGSASTPNTTTWDDVAVTSTLTPPAAPSGLGATTVSDESIDLAWTDNATNETGYTLERSVDGANGWTAVTLPAGTRSYRDAGLAASTTYHYRVRAINDIGTSAYSAIASATTRAAPPQIPAAPTGLAAIATSTSTVNLTWTDNAATEAIYTVERSPDGVTWTVVTSTLPAGTSSYTDTGLSASTAYSYRVKASNASGSSAYSNTASATTQAPPPQPPAAPSALSATAASSTSIDLAWSDNATNETGYTVETSTDGASWTVVTSTLPAGTASYTDTGLTPSTTYSYRVKASNASGSSAYSNTASTTTQAPPPQPPAAPTGLTATAASSTSIDLAWTDNATNETGYTVETTTDGNTWTAVTSTLPAGTSSYTDTGLAPSTTYSYRVKATNAAGSSAYSNTASATTQAPPPQPPAAPTALSATAASSTSIDLAWTDNATDETASAVERSTDGNTWTVVTSTLPAGTSSYTDTGLSASTTYSYRVKATNAAGSSAYSNTASATTQAAAPAVAFAETFTAPDASAWDPTRWTVNTGTTASMDIQANAGRLRFQNVANARALAISKMTKQADTETLMSYRFTSTAANARGYFYIAARASGDWVAGYPATSYFLQLTSDLNTVQIWKSQNNTTTSLRAPTAIATTTTAKQWLRLRIQGDTISAKVWTDGTPEPTTWEITATDTSITGTGLLQYKWQRGGAATTGNDITIDDITTTTVGGTNPQPPTAPTALSATAASSTSIDLAWTDNATDETAYAVDRSPDGAAWTAVTTTLPAGTTTWTDTGLTPTTGYSYRVRATNAVGASAPSNTATATTQTPPPQPPAAPTGLAATAISSASIDLAWTDNATNETGYTVETSTDGNTWTVVTSTLPAGTTTWTDTGLAPSTTYSYRVKATNAAGSSAYSNTASATTQAPPPQPPAAPTTLSATAASSTSIDLAWTDNATNETGYTVETSTDGASWSVVTSTLPAGTGSYTDTGLSASTTYSYRVKATNAAGSSAYSNTASTTTQAPTPAVAFAETFTAPDASAWDPTRWTVNTGTTASMDIQANAGRLRFQNVANARALAISKMTKQADTETLMSYRFTSTAANARGYFYIAARASGDWVAGYPATSYFLQLTSDLNTVQIWKSQNNTTTSLRAPTAIATTTTAKQWLRLRIQGDTISAKVWTDGTPEPTTWEITATDTSITGTGLLQYKWQRGGAATTGNDVTIDDITTTTLG